MTEAEWLVSSDPEAMLEVARFGRSDRRMRLFAVACVRAIVPHLSRAQSKAAVEVLDLYAGGECSRADLRQAWEGAVMALHDIIEDASEQKWHYVGMYAADAVALAANPDLAENIVTSAARCVHTLVTAADWNHEREVRLRECDRQVQLIRDIFGNPFRPVAIDQVWRTVDVLWLAAGIYEERAFDRLPILADALQDAGCVNTDILDHCRGPGPHVRGCWVVDAVLNKE
jgi:hypothetical protein